MDHKKPSPSDQIRNTQTLDKSQMFFADAATQSGTNHEVAASQADILSTAAAAVHHEMPSSSTLTAPLLPSGEQAVAAFLPDFTEHPKPKRRRSSVKQPQQQQQEPQLVVQEPEPEDDAQAEVTFFHDFVAGGVAGSASVVVGHPFDTIKVRIQTAAPSATNQGLMSTLREFGGASSLFRGMAAPLSAAAVINAIVFGSYGVSSRLYDEHVVPRLMSTTPTPTTTITTLEQQNLDGVDYDDYYDDEEDMPTHDPWQKAMTCGAFAGLVQCVVIAPMEHVKCRLQVQHGKGSADHQYKGPAHAVRHIVKNHGWQRLFQGWWVTCLREVPAFGLYFSVYDHLKDKVNTYLAEQSLPLDYYNNNNSQQQLPAALTSSPHSHTWLASALAGGTAGAVTWGVVYPVDIIKSKIQTMPLDTPARDLSMFRVASTLVTKYGWRHLWRGLGITLVRAFPVNGTIFPVYEFTLMQVSAWEKEHWQ